MLLGWGAVPGMCFLALGPWAWVSLTPPDTFSPCCMQNLWFANPGGSNSMPSQSRSSVQRTHSLPVHSSPQAILMFPPGELSCLWHLAWSASSVDFCLLIHLFSSTLVSGFALGLCRLCTISHSPCLLGRRFPSVSTKSAGALFPSLLLPHFPSAYLSFLPCLTVSVLVLIFHCL